MNETDTQHFREDIGDLYEKYRGLDVRLATQEAKAESRDKAIEELKKAVEDVRNAISSQYTSLTTQLTALTIAPAQKVSKSWDSIKSVVFAALVGGVITYIVSKLV